MRYGLKNINALFDLISNFVNKRFTGTLRITIDFSDGGIRKCVTNVEQAINLGSKQP